MRFLSFSLRFAVAIRSCGKNLAQVCYLKQKMMISGPRYQNIWIVFAYVMSVGNQC